MAVRASLGATHARLASLLFAESLVLALPAALLSLPVASLLLRLASRVPRMPETASEASVSMAAALLAIAVAVGSAVAVGLLPLRRLVRVEYEDGTSESDGRVLRALPPEWVLPILHGRYDEAGGEGIEV
ncbi:MAG: FtsX-like permease family protein [Gammaproteobacteria bacterium]